MAALSGAMGADEEAQFCFVRGFGGTGTGLATMMLQEIPSVSTMQQTTAKYEDEGQYLQTVFPEIRHRTTERCGGSIASCSKMRDEVLAKFGSFQRAKDRLVAEWGKWWEEGAAIRVEKTPDLAIGLLSSLFPNAYVLLTVRHPYFWHHSRHCPDHDPRCLLQTWSELMRDSFKRLFHEPRRLRGIVVRYEDMATKHDEVRDGIRAALGLVGQNDRRSLSLRGHGASRTYLWEFSGHDGGRLYATSVKDCVEKPGRCREVVAGLGEGLLEAFGYDVMKTSNAVVDCENFRPVALSISSSLHKWVFHNHPRQEEDGGLLVVLQAYSVDRTHGLVDRVFTKFNQLSEVRGIMIIWNNAKELWPFANDTRFDRLDASPLESSTMPRWKVESNKPLLVFAAEDRVDNHYALPALIAEGDFRAAIIVDDDVDPGTALFSCFNQASLVHPHLMLAPASNLRAFLNPIEGKHNPMRHPVSNPIGQRFCAGLPQFILVPFSYLRAYSSHSHLLDFVRTNQICDDYALYAVARREGGGKKDVLAGIAKGIEHTVTTGSLAKSPGHYERRNRCWEGVTKAFRIDHPEINDDDPVFLPSSKICTCAGFCKQQAEDDFGKIDQQAPRVCEDVVK